MSIVRDPAQVGTVTTRKGWAYRVVPGTFHLIHDDSGNPMAIFEAYNPRGGFGVRSRVSIWVEEVASIVEEFEA